jgi:phage-related protein
MAVKADELPVALISRRSGSRPYAKLSDTIEVLRAFPDKARRDAGFQLDKVQETSRKDIKLARKRYKELMRTQP